MDSPESVIGEESVQGGCDAVGAFQSHKPQWNAAHEGAGDDTTLMTLR